MERQTHTINAEGKSLGRLASEIVILLRGKHKQSWAPHKDVGDFVAVKNLEKAIFTGRKLEQKRYYKHSGYPGGLKEEKLRDFFKRNPAAVLRRIVWGMLPKNKLRARQIKRLLFS